MNVAHQRVATGFDCFDSLLGLAAKQFYRFARISDLVDANIDNRSAGLDMIAANKSRPSNRSDENICLAGHACQVPRTRMANRYGRVPLQE